MLRGAQPVVVQLSGPGWPSVPSTSPPRRVPAQGPTEEVPWAWGHLHTQLHTSTWAWTRPISCSNSLCFRLSLCMLSRSFPQSRAWTRVAWGGRGRYYQPFLQLLPHCRGVAGHRVSVWEASTQPDSLPRALRGHSVEQAVGPDHRSLPSVRGGRFPGETWGWSFAGGRNLHGCAASTCMVSLDPRSFAGN